MDILRLLENSIDEITLGKLKSSGYDVDDLLYHGTNAEFDKFDRSFSRTASHIYTTPDPNTASNYGKNVYKVAPRIKKMADLIEDYELLNRLSIELAEQFARDLRYTYKTHDAIYSDKGLLERVPILVSKKEEVDKRFADIKEMIFRDSEVGEEDLADELRYSDEYDELMDELRLLIARADVYELLRSSKVYEYDNGKLRDEVMDICYGWGYNCVRFYDYSLFGESESIVFEDAEDLVILGLYEG